VLWVYDESPSQCQEPLPRLAGLRMCGTQEQENENMRAWLFASAVAAVFALPISAHSQDVEIGPGGFRVYPHHRHYGYGADCRELREACLKKEELGEEGRGNCRRYREVCRGY